MKKILTLTLVFALLIAAAIPAMAEAKHVIAYCTREPADDAFQNMLEKGIRDTVAANPDFELWMLTVKSMTDVSEQANTIEEAVAAGVDAIIVNPNDGTTCLEAIKVATEAGIPVVTVDGRLEDGHEDYYITQVGADNVQAGQAAAEMLMELRPEGGKYIVVRGINGNVVLDTRGDSFKKALEGSNWECASDMNNITSDNEGAMTVVENMLAAASYDVDVVFAGADSWFPGIAQALQDAELYDDITMIGIDGSNVGLDYFEDGHAMALIQVRPDKISAAAAQICIDLVNGAASAEDYEPVTNVPVYKLYEEGIAAAREVAF